MTDKKPSTLIEALTAFQRKHHAAGRDGKNPFYKSSYTTLGQALLAVQPATEFGLCHIQPTKYEMTPEGDVITIVITKLMHVSGQSEISEYPVPKPTKNVTNDHQEAGKALTYARRYCLLAMYGLAGEDDDAQSLTKAPSSKKGIARTPTKPKQQLEAVESIKDKNYGTPITKDALSAVVSKMKNLSEQFPDKKDSVINKFKKQFDIKAEKIGPADIRTAEQGQFLTIAINEIDSSL